MNQYEAWQQRLELLRSEIPSLLNAGVGQSVLYVGATPHRFQMGRELHEVGYQITLLEAFKPFAEHYQGHPWLADVICGDVRDIKQLANGRKWDVAVWWHGPEHVGRAELDETISGLEDVIDCLVVLGSPWGQNVHGMVSGNPYSQHQDHYDVGAFAKLGYETATLGQKDNPATWCHIMAWKLFDEPELITDDELVVYTAIFGDYDELQPVNVVHRGVRHVCFSDVGRDVPGWETLVTERRFADPRRDARQIKLLSHLYVDAGVSIWHDGNIRLAVDPQELVACLGDLDVAVFEHPSRSCIYSEAQAILDLDKAGKNLTDSQTACYIQQGYPSLNGLAATGVVVRRHTESVVRLNEAWWAQLSRFTARDQLSFNYVCWKLGMRYAVIPGYLWQNDWMAQAEHK